MEVIKSSLDEFINGKKFFKIPVYQRKYDWEKEQCRQLFDDIERIISTGKPHFLGTFVYQRRSKDGSSNFDEYVVIDGQQRITTIILIAKALYEVSDEEDKEEISSTFIKQATGKGMKGKFKLEPTEYDTRVFEKLMAYENFDENNFDDTEKSSMLYQNYVFFIQRISSYDADDIYKAIQNLKIVGINVESGENPQEIFESINSTGLALSQSDLIRNYLLMDLDYDCQEDLYRKYWLQIELLLHSTEVVEKFIVQYLITKRRSNSLLHNNQKKRLSKNILYFSFKKYFEENYDVTNKSEEVGKYLNDMYRYAKFYNKFLFREKTEFDRLSNLEKKFYELVFLLDATNAPIILMYLYDKFDIKVFDEETFIKFVNAMISFTFRSKLCGTKGISSQFAGNVILKLEKEEFLDEDAFWKIITFGKGDYSFPNDEKFKNSLINSDLQATLKSDGCRYLLYFLEKNAEHSKELPKCSGETASIEHIMPRTLNDDWKKSLSNDIQYHERWLNTLGNLTLTAYNSELSNSSFDKKKSIYADSGFFYTKELKNFPYWDAGTIQARAKKLANVALKIWNLPEKYNSVIIENGNIFTLDSDLGIFTGTKPLKVSIDNRCPEIKNWREFLREIMKTLYTLDKNTFKQIIQMDNVPRGRRLFSTEETNLGRPIKIDENFYIEDAYDFDTETVLKISKILVENFDLEGDTNFKEDIWFTIKN